MNALKGVGVILCALCFWGTAMAAPEFDKLFHDETMRIDYYHTGSAEDIATAKAESEAWSKSHQQQVDAWFESSEFFGQVGAFEGAGYISEGMYRSQLDCIMFTKGLKKFCAACEAGIREVTERYTE